MLMRGFAALIAVVATVVLYLITIYVLGLVGLHAPDKLLTAIFVLVGLVSVYFALSGRWDGYFKPGP